MISESAPPPSTGSAEGQQPTLLRVGLIADVQHADIADGRSDNGAVRYYRDAPEKARLAAEDWEQQGCCFAVNLGDTIDRRAGADAAKALQRVLAAFSAGGFVSGPTLHIAGNHDLSALDLEEVATELNPARLLAGQSPAVKAMEPVLGASADSWYCDVRIGPGWRALLLDSYDVAVRRDASVARPLLQRLLDESLRKGQPSQHLAQHEQLNGAVGQAQLAWLGERLAAAGASGDRVVVFSHAPFRPEVAHYQDALCWNWQEVNSLLESFAHIVAAVITGHDHFGREATTEAGIYHRVLEAAMEGELGTPTHALLEFHGPDELRLMGRGAVRSWARRFPPLAGEVGIKRPLDVLAAA